MPYKDAERRREYQRRYYRDRNVPRPHNPNEIPQEQKSFVTKSIRFEEDDYRNLTKHMLNANSHAGKPMELFNFSEMARNILFEWGAEQAMLARRARLEPVPEPVGPAF